MEVYIEELYYRKLSLERSKLHYGRLSTHRVLIGNNYDSENYYLTYLALVS